MDVIIAGAGIGGLTTALGAARGGHRRRDRLRVRARTAAARRRHQPAAACGARAHRARAGRAPRRDRRGHEHPVVLQPARPADLERAARPRGRVRLAAVLGAPRRGCSSCCATRSSNASVPTPFGSVARSTTRRMTVSARACGSPSTAAPSGRHGAARVRRCRGRRRRHPLAPFGASTTPTRARRSGTG